MRGPCHSLTPCAASLARNPPVPRRPLRQPGSRRGGRRADQLCSILRIHPIADDTERRVPVETEPPHEIGDGAVHVAASSRPQAPQEDMEAAKGFAGALFHPVSSLTSSG